MDFLGTCTEPRIHGSARVAAVHPDALDIEHEGQVYRARIAYCGPDPRPGDRVVLAGADSGEFFALGVVRTGHRPAPGFTYDEERRVTRLELPEGDLELVTREGSIRLLTRDGLIVDAGSVGVRSRAGVSVVVGGLLEAIRSQLTMSRHATSLSSGRIEVESDDATLAAERMCVRGQSMDAEIDDVRLEGERYERKFGSVITSARSAYRSVAELSQEIAGRIRTIVSGHWHLHSESAELRADHSVAIDGEHIDLG